MACRADTVAYPLTITYAMRNESACRWTGEKSVPEDWRVYRVNTSPKRTERTFLWRFRLEDEWSKVLRKGSHYLPVYTAKHRRRHESSVGENQKYHETIAFTLTLWRKDVGSRFLDFHPTILMPSCNYVTQYEIWSCHDVEEDSDIVVRDAESNLVSLILEERGTNFLIDVSSCLDQDLTDRTLMEAASCVISSVIIYLSVLRRIWKYILIYHSVNFNLCLNNSRPAIPTSELQ